MRTFGNMAINGGFGTSNEKQTITLIPVNEICLRFENKYIINSDKANALKESIKKVGLIEPISVVNIDSFLQSSAAQDDETCSYLKEMKSKGFKYFVSSGHRRFKAFISLLTETDINTDQDWKNNIEYINDIYIKLNQEKTEAFAKGVTENRLAKYLTIPCIIEKDVVNENIKYNDSNTTQRELTAFEITVNIIDELKKDGTYEDIMKEAVKSVVDSLTERSINDRITQLIRKGCVSIEMQKESLDTKKECLMDAPFNEIRGADNAMNVLIAEEIKKRKSRNVSVSYIRLSRQIADSLDPRITQLIFDGVISATQAREFLGKKIDVEKTVEMLRNGTYEPETKKTKKAVKKNLTKIDLKNLIYEIKNGTKTIEEVIEIIG